ncbi:MAG: GAF domain-containing protein, partial [Streptosporangiaceae bacterium]
MRGGLNRRALLASLALGAVVAGCFALLASTFASLHAEETRDDRSADVLATSNALQESVLNLETGLRGYLLSSRALFLQPYRGALTVYPGQARDLDQLTAGNPSLNRRAVALGTGVTAYARDWTEPVIQLSRSNLAAARRREASGGGKARVDALRRQFAALNRRQMALASQQRSAAESTNRLTVTLGLTALVLAVLLITWLAIGLRRGVVVPVNRLAAAVGLLRRGSLSARVPERGTAEIGELAAGFNAMASELEAARDEVEQQNAELQGQQVELENLLAAVEEQKGEAEALHRFAEQLAAQTRIEDVAEVTLREIADYAGAQVGAVYVLNEQAGTITFRAARGARTGDFAPELPPGEGLAGRALAEQRPITAGPPQASLRLPGLVSDREIQHEVHLPLIHRDRVIGVLSLGRSRDEEFTPGQVKSLTDLARSAALACAEALSLRQLEVAATELQSLMDSTDEGIYRRDLDGRITFINRAALEQKGYTAEELLGRDAHPMLHHSYEDGRPYPAEECPLTRTVHYRAGARFAGEVFWRKDGTSFPIDCSAFPLFDGEAVNGLVVTFRDISETKLAEHQLAAQYRTARVLAQADSIEEALPRILELCCDELGWQMCVAWAADGNARELHCRAAHARGGWEDQLALLSHETVILGQGTVGRAWQRRQPVTVPGRAGLLQPPGAGGLPPGELVVPIVRDGDVVGVVQLIGPAQPRVDGQPQTIETIVAQVGQYADRQRSDAAAARMKDQFVATV